MQPLDQSIDLGHREAGERDVERVVVSEEPLQFLGEQLVVPAGVERQLVVGNHIGALLRRRHGLDPDAGHGLHLEQHRRRQPPMARKHAVVIVDEERVGKAELGDAGCELPDLLFRMGPGVFGPGLQR